MIKINDQERKKKEQEFDNIFLNKNINKNNISDNDNLSNNIIFNERAKEFDEIFGNIEKYNEKENNYLDATDSINTIDTSVINSTDNDNQSNLQEKSKKKLDIFDSAAFSDGYQVGDITKSTLGTLSDITQDLASGVSSVIEAPIDIGANIIASVQNLLGYDEAAKKTREWANKNYSEKVGNFVANVSPVGAVYHLMNGTFGENIFENDSFEKGSILGETSDKIANLIGYTGGLFAGGAALEGIGLASSISVPIAGHTLKLPLLAITGGMSGGLQEANLKGDNVTEKERWAKAISSGLIEGTTEGMFGLFGIGGNDLTDELIKRATSKMATGVGKTLAQIGIQSTGEAIEEFLSYAGNYVADNLIIDNLGKTDFSTKWDWGDVGEQMALAFASTALSSGGSVMVNNNKAIKSAEKQLGRKLNNNEKAKVTQDVINASIQINEAKELDPDSNGKDVITTFITNFDNDGNIQNIEEILGRVIQNPNKNVNVKPAIFKNKGALKGYNIVDVNSGIVLDNTQYKTVEDAEKGFTELITNLNENQEKGINDKVKKASLSVYNSLNNLLTEQFASSKPQNINTTEISENSKESNFGRATNNITVQDIKKLTDEFDNKETLNIDEVAEIWNKVQENNLDVAYDNNGNIDTYVAIEGSGDNLVVNRYDSEDNIVDSVTILNQDGKFNTQEIKDTIKQITNVYDENNDNNTIEKYIKEMAINFQDDLANSLPGARYKIEDNWTGQKRSTTKELANIKDETGASWNKIGEVLQDIADGKGNNTKLARLLREQIDTALSRGYKNIYGKNIVPNEEYLKAKGNIDGVNYLENQTSEDLSYLDEEDNRIFGMKKQKNINKNESNSFTDVGKLTDEEIKNVVKFNQDGREIKDNAYIDFMVERYKDNINISNVETDTKYIDSISNKSKKEKIDDLYTQIKEKQFKTIKKLNTEDNKMRTVELNLLITKRGLNESFNKGYSDEKYAIVPYLDILIKTSQDGIIRNESKQRSNINEWYYLYNTAKINNQLYSVKIDIRKTPQGDRFYVHRVNLVHKKGTSSQIPAVGNGTIKTNKVPSINNSITQKDTNVKNNTVINNKSTQKSEKNTIEERKRTNDSNQDTNNSNTINLQQDIGSFSQQVDEVLKGTFPKNDMLTLLSKTPQPLLDIGLTDLPITMTQNHLKTIISDSGTDKNVNYHGLGIDIVKQLPEAISNPLDIVESKTRNDSVVLTTYLADNQDRTIIASIKIDGKGQINSVEIDTNVMTSAYGRNNYEQFMEDNLKNDRLLYDIDRGIIKKVDMARLQLPRHTNLEVTGARLQLPRSSNSTTKTNGSVINNSITQKDTNVKNNTVINKSMQNTKNNTNNDTYSQKEIKKELHNRIQNALISKNSRKNTFLGKVNQKVIDKVKKLYGIDVSNRNHLLADNDIRYMIKEHGNPEIEKTKGQIAITTKDIEKIPDIINDFDRLITGNDNKQGKTIRFIKTYNDNQLYVVEVIPNANDKTLYVKTMWKKAFKNKKEPVTLTNSQKAPSSTSKTRGNLGSNTSIPQNTKNVKNDDVRAMKINQTITSPIMNNYDETTANRIKMSTRNVIVKNNKHLSNLVNEAINSNENKALHLGKLDEETINNIKNKIQNLPNSKQNYLTKNNYDLVINQSEIRHLLDDKVGLTEKDINHFIQILPDIISNSDYISYTNNLKDEGLRFKKLLKDGTYVSFVVVSNKQGTMKVKTIYMEKGDYENKKRSISLTTDVDTTPDNTSKTNRAFASNTSIPQNSENVKNDGVRSMKTNKSTSSNNTQKVNNTSPTSNDNIRFARRSAKQYNAQRNAERKDSYIEQEIQKIEQSGNWDDTIPVTKMTDIRKTIENYLGLGVKKGHFRERAYGIYKNNRDVIRTKELKDMDTILHETGHALDLGNRIKINKESIADELLKAVNKYGGYETDSRTIQLDEGFAEVIREYSIIPEQAKIDYPQTVAVIEEIGNNDKSFNNFIGKVQQQTYNYIHQNPRNRALSNMSIGEQTDKVPLSTENIKKQIIRQFWDENYPIKNTVKVLQEAQGKTVNELKASENINYLIRLSNNIGNKVSSILSNGYIDENGNKLMPGLNQIGEVLRDNAERYNDLRAYLVAQRDLEYKAKTLKTGIRTTDSQAIVNNFKNDTQIQEASKIIYDTLDGVLQYAVNNHLISPETANSLKESNAFYVPMQRVLDNKSNQVGKKGALTDIIKARTGSELDVKDVLENIVANSANIIQQVENNKVLNALYKQGEASGLTGAVYDVIPAPMTKIGTANLQVWENELKNQGINTEDLDLNKTIDLFIPNNKINVQEKITSFINDEGKRIYLQFNDDLFFNTLMGLDTDTSNMIFKVAGWLNAPLRYGATMANLGFAIPNMISDTAQATIFSTAGFIPVIDNALGVLDILTATNSTVQKFMDNVAPDYVKKINEMYTLYEQEGAATGTRLSQERSSTQKLMKDIYGTKNSEVLGIPEKFKPLKRLLDFMTYIPEISEQSTRFRVFERNYDYYKNKGMAETDTRIMAALESRDATQDFSRMGKTAKYINQLIPFSAARLGSSYTFAEKIKANPKMVTTRIAILTALAMAIKALGYKDKEIEELNQRKKDDNFVLKVGDNVVTIKKPQGILRSIINLTEYIEDLTTGHIEEGKEGKRLSNWVLNSIMDNSVTDNVTGLVPSAITPIIENAINKDLYYNTDIVKSYDLDLPDADQYYDYNSQLAIWLGKIFNYSPAKIDNFISGYFGGLGTQLTGIIDNISSSLGLSTEKPKMGAESDTIGKRFVVNVNSNSSSLDQIYNRKTELTKLKNGGTITAEETSELEKLTEAVSNISKLNKQIKSIKADLTLSGTEKAKQIKELQKQRTDTARKALGKDLIYPESQSKIELTEFYPTVDILSKNNYKLSLNNEMKTEYAKLANAYYSKYESQGIYNNEKLEKIKTKAKDYAKNELFKKYNSSLIKKTNK